jgi:hypothetical protein
MVHPCSPLDRQELRLDFDQREHIAVCLDRFQFVLVAPLRIRFACRVRDDLGLRKWRVFVWLRAAYSLAKAFNCVLAVSYLF